jgi:hypothetical protein
MRGSAGGWSQDRRCHPMRRGCRMRRTHSSPRVHGRSLRQDVKRRRSGTCRCPFRPRCRCRRTRTPPTSNSAQQAMRATSAPNANPRLRAPLRAASPGRAALPSTPAAATQRAREPAASPRTRAAPPRGGGQNARPATSRRSPSRPAPAPSRLPDPFSEPR